MTLSAVGGVNAAISPSPVSPVAPASATSDTATRSAGAGPHGEDDKVTQQPVPLRFPWLSRLSTELEQASGKPAPFSPAPVLGDHLDSQA